VGVFSVNTGFNFMVQNLTITNGNSRRGAGINNGGTLTVTNSAFSGNSARHGGGIFNDEGGRLTVTDSTFLSNSAPGSGGGRPAAGLGGGILSIGPTAVSNSTFSGNNADAGGGIFGGLDGDGTLTLTNCTLSGNSASDGGGIYHFAFPPLTLTNCTLSGNSATSSGGGIGGYGTTTLRNTIVANSPSGGDCATTILVNDDGHNLIQDATSSCGLSNGVNGNVVGVDPLLGPLMDNGGPTQTIALLPGSPAIGTGDPDVCANPLVNGLDQRGYVRPGADSASCSIGAYEYNSSGPPPVTLTPTPTPTATPHTTPTATGGPSCTGDCNDDDTVAINELIVGVNIALERQPANACPAFASAQGTAAIAQLIKGVNNALNGCGD
jgi:hypothetical protein